MLSEDIFLEFRIQELAPPVSLHCSGQQAPGEDNIDAFEAQNWWSNRATVQHFEGMAQHTRDNRDGGDESERRMQKKALFPQNRSILFFKKKNRNGINQQGLQIRPTRRRRDERRLAAGDGQYRGG
jgi:hypothetical protein